MMLRSGKITNVSGTLFVLLEKAKQQYIYNNTKVLEKISNDDYKYDNEKYYRFKLHRYNLLKYIPSCVDIFILTQITYIIMELYGLYFNYIGICENKRHICQVKCNQNMQKKYTIEIIKAIYCVYSHIFETFINITDNPISFCDELHCITKLLSFITNTNKHILFILKSNYGITNENFNKKDKKIINDTNNLLFMVYLQNIIDMNTIYIFILSLWARYYDKQTMFNKIKSIEYFKREINNYDYKIIDKYGTKKIYFEELMQNRFHPRNFYKFDSWGFETGLCDNE